jgi:hypothetical protein
MKAKGAVVSTSARCWGNIFLANLADKAFVNFGESIHICLNPKFQPVNTKEKSSIKTSYSR